MQLNIKLITSLLEWRVLLEDMIFFPIPYVQSMLVGQQGIIISTILVKLEIGLLNMQYILNNSLSILLNVFSCSSIPYVYYILL